MGAQPDRGLWRSPVGVGGGRQCQPFGGIRLAPGGPAVLGTSTRRPALTGIAGGVQPAVATGGRFTSLVPRWAGPTG